MDELRVGRPMGFSSIPFDARPPKHLRDVLSDAKAGMDFIAHNLPPAHRVLTRLNPYPAPWRLIDLEGEGGARLAGVYGPGRRGAPAILMVPGTFQTKDDTSRKRRALELWRRYGAHVLILDLRGFGGSHEALGTAGYFEAKDLHHGADWLRAKSGAARVTLWGESLGASCSLLAAALPGAEDRFERVVAWSPFADLAEACRVSIRQDRLGQQLIGAAYRWLLRVRTHREVNDFREYLESRSASIGITCDELMAVGSPVRHVERLAVPCMVFHAEDDPVVPVAHARLLQDASPRAPRLRVHVLPRGGHLDFDRQAPEWFAAVMDALFDQEAKAA